MALSKLKDSVTDRSFQLALDYLEPHIRSGLGIAMMADNGKYVMPYTHGTGDDVWGESLEARSDVKTTDCRFLIELDGDNQGIRFRSVSNGKYVAL